MSSSPTSDTNTTTPTLAQPNLHAVLSSERRIHIIDILAEIDDDWIARVDLATLVAERTAADRETIYSSLYHHHLPKLADDDVIEQGTVFVDPETGEECDQDTDNSEERHVIWRGRTFDSVLNASNAVALSQGVPVDE